MAKRNPRKGQGSLPSRSLQAEIDALHERIADLEKRLFEAEHPLVRTPTPPGEEDT